MEEIKHEIEDLRRKIGKLAEEISRQSEGTERLSAVQQYERCSEDWRVYENQIWQTPTALITIGAIAIAQVYGVQNRFMRVLLLTGILLLGVAVIISLFKHRLFQTSRARTAERLEQEAGLNTTPVTTGQAFVLELAEDSERRLNWFENQKGHYWLLATAFAFTCAVLMAWFGELYFLIFN